MRAAYVLEEHALVANLAEHDTSVCEFLETVSSIDRQGHLSPTFYELAEEHFRNSWRTGTQVHGKRYQKSSPTIDAAST